MIISKLILKGISKDYSYEFSSGLNIISGPISTGKTSLVEFIDYCLGSNYHPEHIEIQRKVRAVFLEVVFQNKTYVIERFLFSTKNKAYIHECLYNDINEKHEAIEVYAKQTPGEESISTFILKKYGLLNIFLKEAPTQKSSGMDMMSFRDIMWFCFLKNERLDNKDLLFEKTYMKKIKLLQVFEVIFHIHGNELSQLSNKIRLTEKKLREVNSEIKAITNFLKERKVKKREDLEEIIEKFSKEEQRLESELNEISKILGGSSSETINLRKRLDELNKKLQQIVFQKRNKELLLKRLLLLRGQYSEDIKKMEFLQESRVIFNPLNLVKCPICLSKLDLDPKNLGENCSLCGNHIESEPIEAFDVKKEIRTIKTKYNDLNNYISDLEEELLNLNKQKNALESEEIQRQQQLDTAMKEFVSPYISKRDKIVKDLTTAQQSILATKSQLSLIAGIDKKIAEKNKIESDINTLEVELEAERAKIKNRNQIIKKIQAQFEKLLIAFNFPKLHSPNIKNDLTPFVRNLEYKNIGSSGALTLISISWFLSIFEVAMEIGTHPGFVIIDSPQKNIGKIDSENGSEVDTQEGDSDFDDVHIVEGMYRHFIEMSENTGRQWIIIDNSPPKIAEKFVKYRFTRSTSTPPYGLIDDEVS